MTEFKEALDSVISDGFLSIVLMLIALIPMRHIRSRFIGAVYITFALGVISVFVSAKWLLGLY